jgi:hypothetical protein
MSDDNDKARPSSDGEFGSQANKQKLTEGSRGSQAGQGVQPPPPTSDGTAQPPKE